MTDSVITEIPIPEDEGYFFAWMDWRGADVLKLLHEDKVDAIYWGITDTEKFERAKRLAYGRILCVTGKHPEDDSVNSSWGEYKKEKPEGFTGGWIGGTKNV